MKKVNRAYFSGSLLETKKLGAKLARKILKNFSPQKAVFIALKGNLGGGKTSFAQGFARGLAIKEKITSPTFVIMKKFKIKNSKFKNFYHLDCYRLKKPEELFDLGFREITSNPENIIAVEWADKIKKILPEKSLWVHFEFINKNKRKIVVLE